MQEQPKLGRKVVVKTHRKHGNGAVGGGRKNSTGKRGIIYGIKGDKEVELTRCDASTFRELKRKLYETGYIPRNVSISSSGETAF